MNIATDEYTEEYLLEKLKSSKRIVKYEYVLADRNKHPIGQIPISDGKITFDSTKSVMRTFKGTVQKADLIAIGDVDFRITPYMCLKIGISWVKWPLGEFLIKPQQSGQNNKNVISLTGYDNGKIAYDHLTTSRFYVPEGALYSVYIAQKLGENYNNANIAESPKIKANPIEFDIGARNLDIVNTLLNAIGYDKLYFDERGVPTSAAYKFPQLRDVERIYDVSKNSVITDGVNIETNTFEIPNKFVRYTESADSEYLIASYTNENENDPYSVPNRGRIIPDVESVTDIATQDDLNNYVRMVAVEKMQKTNAITFNTLNMPGHGYRNCLLLNINMYGIAGRYIETAWEMTLKPGGLMTHKCEKVVNL